MGLSWMDLSGCAVSLLRLVIIYFQNADEQHYHRDWKKLFFFFFPSNDPKNIIQFDIPG